MEHVGLRPLLQEVVEGELLALSLVLGKQGEVLVAMQSVGEPQTWPPETGMWVRSRTVAVDDDLRERVGCRLASQGWWGLADVDFIAPRGETPRLVDGNGRIFGSMSLAVRAGVNLSDQWARLVVGLPTPTGMRGRAGVRCQWLEDDLRLARHGPRRARALLSTVREATRSAHSTTSLRDSVPVLVRTAALLRSVGRRGLADARQAGGVGRRSRRASSAERPPDPRLRTSGV